jgi:hypothetical protein
MGRDVGKILQAVLREVSVYSNRSTRCGDLQQLASTIDKADLRQRLHSLRLAPRGEASRLASGVQDATEKAPRSFATFACDYAPMFC